MPDYVLGLADQLVNVDLPAEDLRERLKAGKIYPQERVERALVNFFTDENLTRLREMALAEIAHLLDRRRREQKDGPDARATSERVMVCLSSRSPNSEQLLRKAARLAGRLGAPWYAVYVQTPAEELHRVEAAVQRRVYNTLTLTTQLGGTPFQYKGADVVSTIAAFAREYGITQILVGRTRQPWYKRWFGPSFLDRLVLAVERADVVVAGHF